MATLLLLQLPYSSCIFRTSSPTYTDDPPPLQSSFPSLLYVTHAASLTSFLFCHRHKSLRSPSYIPAHSFSLFNISLLTSLTPFKLTWLLLAYTVTTPFPIVCFLYVILQSALPTTPSFLIAVPLRNSHSSVSLLYDQLTSNVTLSTTHSPLVFS